MAEGVPFHLLDQDGMDALHEQECFEDVDCVPIWSGGGALAGGPGVFKGREVEKSRSEFARCGLRRRIAPETTGELYGLLTSSRQSAWSSGAAAPRAPARPGRR